MSRDIRRALMIARNHFADGGETDPMQDQDVGNFNFSQIPIVPNIRDGSTFAPRDFSYNPFPTVRSAIEAARAAQRDTQVSPMEAYNRLYQIQDPMQITDSAAARTRMAYDEARPSQTFSEMLPSGQDVKDAAMMAGAGFGSFVPETAHFVGMAKDVLSGKRPDFDAKTPFGYEEMVERAKHAGEISENPSVGAQLIGAGSQFLTDPVNIASALKAGAGAKLAMGIAPKVAGVDRAVELAKAPRTDLGFYSHGAETAANLPQAKGTPQQFKSMLEKNGVKPAELEGFDEAFAGRPSVTREELAQHFNERMPQVEEVVSGGKKSVEQRKAELEAIGDNRSLREENELSDIYNGDWVAGDYPHDKTATKFEKHTLPGGENYREVRLKLPDAGRPPTFDEWYEKTHINPMPEDNPRMMAMLIENYTRDMKNMPQEGNFNSSHWPNDPNVLAHIRMSDRVGPNGEKLLHVEELQSDWGQKGRKEGFSNSESIASTKEKIDQFSTQYDQLGRERRLAEQEMSDLPDYNERFNELQNRVSEIGRQRDLLSDQMASLRSTIKGNAVPTAPYVTSTQGWTDLALKRVMKEAAEGGYDGVVFTPGAEQAKRYNLSNHVNSIDYMKEGNDAYRLGIVNKSGEEVNLPKDTFTAKELEEYLGKEVAKKIIDDEGKSYSGRNHKTLENLDLEVGGKGMKGYYDEIVPTQLQKLIKQYDKNAKINNKIVSLPNDFYPIEKDADLTTPWRLESRRALHGKYATKEEAINAMNSALNPQMLHVPITDKMRSSILSGQKAFKRGGEVKPYNANDAIKISSKFGPVAAQDAVNVAKQLARGRP